MPRFEKCLQSVKSFAISTIQHEAPVAQLDRVSDYESGGRLSAFFVESLFYWGAMGAPYVGGPPLLAM